MQLAVHPSDPNVLVLRYDYGGDGLLYSRDGGRTFKLMCGSSVSDPSTDAGAKISLGPIGIGGDGRVLMGEFDGLWSDDGKGCGWSRALGALDRWVIDIVGHPSDPGVTFLVTSNGGDALNGIIRRNADGTLIDLGTKEQLLIRRLRVVERPDGGLRFYESVVLEQVPDSDANDNIATKPNYGIRVSDDEGMTWTVHELGTFDGVVDLEAVDPSNPDRLVFTVKRDVDEAQNVALPDDVLVSDDQGASTRLWTSVTRFAGLTFSPQGEVWIGDAGDSSHPDALRGLQHAASLDDDATLVTNAFAVHCVHYTGDALLVCQRLSFGRMSLDYETFTPLMTFSKVESLVECEGVDTAAACRPQLCGAYCLDHFVTSPVCTTNYDSKQLIGCAPPQPPVTSGASGAGAVTAGAGGDIAISGAGGTAGAAGMHGGGLDAGLAGPSERSSGGCGCTIVAASRSMRGLHLMLLALFAGVRLARRRVPSAARPSMMAR